MKVFFLLLAVSALSVVAIPQDYGYAQSSACPSIVNKSKPHVSFMVWFSSLFQPNPSMVNK